MEKKLLYFILVSLSVVLSLNPVLKAEVYGTISGKVIDKVTKKGIGKVNVDIFGNIRKTVSTDKEGNYVFRNIPAGDYQIELNSYSNYRAEKELIEVLLASGSNLIDVNFYLEKMGSISGRVYQSDTTSINGEYLYNNIFAYNTTDTVYLGYSDWITFGDSVSEATGDFSIEELSSAPSWHLLYVFGIKGSTSVYEYNSLIDLNNNEDIQNVEFVLNALESTRIYGRIKDINGNYIVGGFGDLTIRPANNHNWFEIECRFDNEGRYSIQGDIVPGEYDLRIQLGERDTTRSGNPIKAFYIYDTSININNNEQRELDLIFDSSKATRKEFPFRHNIQ